MDIRSPRVLKFKAALFVLLALIAAGLLALDAWEVLSWKVAVLYLLSVWAFCRAYYFCFYVMEKYADPNFRYTGLLDLMLHFTGFRK